MAKQKDVIGKSKRPQAANSPRKRRSESFWKAYGAKRRIARELGIDRETVAKYVNLTGPGPKPATNAPTGSDSSKPAKAPIGPIGQDTQKRQLLYRGS